MTVNDRPTPHDRAPLPGEKVRRHHEGCLGCGDVEPGLHLTFVAGDDLTVTSVLDVRHWQQGGPGLVHGGVVAAALDETMGALQAFFGRPAVTAELTTSYRTPIPVGTQLYLWARVEEREGRKTWTTGTARLDGPDGPVAAEGRGLFIDIRRDHFDGTAVRAVNP
ncbi:PaaI family thioesterase [Pseudonocardia sp. RS11V-5]|uniref:PaaI family thioesterase n=1 Tax=Pseudonocardia terrae TaxID=2905831 RepID=UPI001E5BE5FF|nr:PaaI family thioesterase [Pseudonocardia terrae]MCE3552492.1 PaaI family thioesterase [Pseudonocardia terrae]